MMFELILIYEKLLLARIQTYCQIITHSINIKIIKCYSRVSCESEIREQPQN